MDPRTGILGMLCLATGLSVASAPAEEQAEVKALLERMAEAVRVLDYQGTFVYLQNNQLEALEIEHRRGESGTRERLFSLNGSAREVVRDGATVTCILPDRDSVLVDQRVAQGSFPDLLGIGIDELAENYRFEWLGHDRVAGRAAQVVAIVPRDNLRYGYRLYLDRDSGLPLKSDLMDEAGDPVEQSMFTSLQVDPESLGRLTGLHKPSPPPRSSQLAAAQLGWVFFRAAQRIRAGSSRAQAEFSQRRSGGALPPFRRLGLVVGVRRAGRAGRGPAGRCPDGGGECLGWPGVGSSGHRGR
jgi:sigma-E factor negative regulatory protein RseB